MINVGDVVAYCYTGKQNSRRVRNMTVVRVTKTFIETDDGSRFSAKSFWLTRTPDGTKIYVARSHYIDPDVSYWDRRAEREKTVLQMNSLFSQLAEFAGNRNWQKTKEAFSQLKSFMGE